MSAHAFLAPSSAARWVVCPASAALEAAYPETEESPAAMEGAAAHWVNQERLEGRAVTEGQQAPNGVAVTAEMLEAAELVMATLRDLGALEWRIEQPVRMPGIHPTHNWGTPDYRGVGRLAQYLVDFKYGHGVVEVYENWQMLDYAADGLADVAAEVPADEDTVVHFCIIQPRAYHRDGPVRWWHVRASDLRAYFVRLRDAAAKATGANPPMVPTPEGCEHCRGRHACEALQRAAYKAADLAAAWGTADLPPAALGAELRLLRRSAALLAARLSGLEAQTIATLQAGKPVPGWIMDSVPARLEWAVPPAQVFAYGDMLGLALRKDPAPVTPTQAIALAKGAGLPPNVFAAFSKRPPGAIKLTEDNGAKAAMIFGQPVL